MEIRITHAVPDEGPRSGPVTVGWLLNEERGGVIYSAPTRVRSAEISKRHAKSASRCPAIIGLESRYFEVPCPFDLHLAFVRDQDGKPALRNLLGHQSPVRSKKLASLLHVTNEAEWRYADRPTLQMSCRTCSLRTNRSICPRSPHSRITARTLGRARSSAVVFRLTSGRAH